MDLVLAYVDGNDPQWQADYAEYVGGKPLGKRFRDWGTLPFLLRGVERNMPFVQRVFLVVARESQVPAWVDRSTVRVVLHRDFIPERYLPLFNASSIELFLPRIPDLGERFLYFNDDIFPVLPLQEGDFFVDGKPAKGYAKQLFALGAFQRLSRNADRLACRVSLQRPGPGYLRPQHCCTPLRRSECLKILERVERELPALVSRVRADGNVNQYFFSDVLLREGKAVNRRLSCRHFSLAATSPGRLDAFLANPDRKLVCINDVEMSKSRFDLLRKTLLSALSRRFPTPSRFERTGDGSEAGPVH